MANETKLVAYAPNGGQASMRQLAGSDQVYGGAKNLAQLEMEQYTRARLMAAPANGGTLAQAKEYLEAQGWTCYWDGAPPKLDTRFELRLTADEKGWVLEHGGADMVRTLIRAARERQEATDAPAT